MMVWISVDVGGFSESGTAQNRVIAEIKAKSYQITVATGKLGIAIAVDVGNVGMGLHVRLCILPRSSPSLFHTRS